MADTENREDQKISECLREAFGYSDDQLLKQLDQANETLKDVTFDGAEDRIMKKIMARKAELEKEREHNREKDKQLLDTLNKLAESQAALAAGQAADKQKALAEKIIEGQQQSENIEAIKGNKEKGKIGKIFGKLFRNH